MLQKQREHTPTHAANSKNLNLDETSSSALLHELEAFSSHPEQTDLDADALIACLDQLDELHPLDASFDTEASLSAFRAQHAEAFPDREASKRRRTMPRRARWLAAAAAALLVSGVLLAHAFDVDLTEAIGRWTDETFQFEAKPAAMDQEITVEAYDTPKSFYPSLQDALDAHEVTEPVVPTWIPEGFTPSGEGASATVGIGGVNFYAFYEGDAGTITVDISQLDDLANLEDIYYEKDANDLYTIHAGGNTHYIFQNNGRMVSAWVNGHLACMIAGDISESELLKMIASIYEGGEPSDETNARTDSSLRDAARLPDPGSGCR